MFAVAGKSDRFSLRFFGYFSPRLKIAIWNFMTTPNYSSPWHKTVASKFQFAWDAALPATRNNPYLSRKKIKPYGIKAQGENLLIPIYNKDRVICGLQTITPDGTKKFEYESKVDGCYFVLNEESENSVIYITESYGNAASIAEATDATVVCAFNAGNLPTVAVNIRAKCKNVLVIAGDNDAAGIKFAEKAALGCDGFVSLPPESMDFNDAFMAEMDINKLLSVIYKPELIVEVVREYKDYSSYDETFDKATIEDMLSTIDPNLSYHEWIEIGMALKAGGAGLGVWDGWSKGSAKYKKNDCHAHWNSFKGGAITIGTLVHHAQMNGWTKKYEVVPHKKMSFVDIGAIVENKRKIKTAITSSIKIEVMEFDGLIGDTVKWITDSATFKQPMLATLNVLATLGAVFGRKYRTSKLNTRTNIYTVGVAGTSAGKDHSRKLIANLANEAGLKNILGDNGVRSDSGIVKSLTVQASQVMMIDEFGDFLKGLKDQKAAAHIKAVGRLLLQLYSTSSSLYKHGTYATEKMDSLILHCPNLCIYGTTTEDIYAAAISKEGIKSGELNRFIVLPGDDGAMPCHDIEDTTRIPQHLVDGWKSLNAAQDGNSLAVSTSATFEPEPENIEWGDCWKDACDLLDLQCKKRDEPNGALWGRYRENIIKIALIYCLSEGKRTIEKKHIDTARHYVDLSVQYMNKLANSHMADNQWEELHNEFVRLLEKNNGEMKKFELARAMKKIKRRDFEEMLGGMKEAEIISIESRNNNGNVGRPTVYVRLL